MNAMITMMKTRFCWCLSPNSPCPPEDSTFCYNIDDIDQISNSLGIPWKASKDIPFLDTPTFLGFIWNSDHTVTLTEGKHIKYLTAISKWKQCWMHTLQDVQKLHSKLLHTFLIFPAGHAYLINIKSMLFIFGDNPFKLRTPPCNTPNDLKWWTLTLSNIPFPTFSIPRPQPIFDSQAFPDASGTGIAIIISQHWHTWQLIGNWKLDSHDIAWAGSIGFELLIQAIIGAEASSCYNFLPFSYVLPCLCSTISLLPLCSFTWGDQPLLTHLPVVLFPFYYFSLVPYFITGLSLPLIISLTVVMFPQYSTKFYNLLLR